MPRFRITKPQKKFLQVSFVLVVTLVSAYAYFWGVTPWLFYVEIFTLGALSLTKWMRTMGAVLLSVIGGAAIFSIILPIFQFAVGQFEHKVFVVGIAIIIFSSIVIFKTEHTLNLGGILIKVRQNIAFFITSSLLVILWIVYCFLNTKFSAWAMNNDAVWNTVSMRFIIEDGGIDSGLHPNASPLTAGFLASVTSPGRNFSSLGQLLSHDIALQAQGWISVVIVTSIIAGILATDSFRQISSHIKTIAIVGAMLLPLSWYYWGYAINYGFYNSSLAILLLICVWAVWQYRLFSANVKFWAFALISISLLATWAPLVIIPGAFLSYLLFSQRRDLFSAPRRAVSTIFALMLVGIFSIFTTLNDLLREGSALAVDGGIFNFLPTQFGLMLSSGVLIIIFVAKLRIQARLMNGFLVVTLAAFLGMAILLFQRRNADSLWGYYPQKFGWLVSTLIVLIIFMSLLSVAGTLSFSKVVSSIFTLGTFTFVILMMSLSGLVGLRTILAPVGLFFQVRESYQQNFLPELSELAIQGRKNMAIEYMPTPENDLKLNNWLLQINSQSSDEEIRWYSYFLDGRDISLVCESIKVWGDGVFIHTRNPDLGNILVEHCFDESVQVIVHD